MIASFADDTTRDIFEGKNTKAARKVPKTLWNLAARKLNRIHVAKDLTFLTTPPANRLEKMTSAGPDYYSIRINDQFRIVFHYVHGNASDVLIIDYH